MSLTQNNRIVYTTKFLYSENGLFMGRSTKVPRRGWIEMGELGVVFGSFWVVLGRSSPLNCIYLFVGIYFVVRTACGAPVGLSIHLNQP